MKPSGPFRTFHLQGHLFSLCVAALLSGGAFSFAAAQTDDDSIRRGAELAASKCARCHAIASEGASPNTEAPPFRDLLAKLTLEGIEDELAEGISLGHKPMPQWQFTGQEIYDLSNFIASLSEEEGAD